ncbi:MAG: tetratricopeptide repeat protein [Sedimentisphaerales bacterium]|nr:tetratricopeptide repeat protein [Sedimentisphaerales bacterium]
MLNGKRYAKINVKVLIILIIITVAIVFALFAARQFRRSFLSRISLENGQKAFESKDWVNAYKNFQEYLGRNPDDIEILKKYAESRLSVRPFEPEALAGVIWAYRRVLQLDKNDTTSYEKLAMLYGGIGNYDELAYIAQMRLDNKPDDLNAPLWLANAQTNLNKYEDAQKTLIKLTDEIGALDGKHSEYVKACLMLSNIDMNFNVSPESLSKALDWINKAVEYLPESVDALVNRARFYLETPDIPGYSTNDRVNVARKDLESADRIGSEKPQNLFLLCSQWLTLGEYEKAAAEIQLVDNLSEETIKEYFFDIQGLKVIRFLLASEIALRRGDINESVSLLDESLEEFKEASQRMKIIPTAVKIYAITDKVSEARKYLNEYLENVHKLSNTTSVEIESAYMQALVATAEGKPYLVIDILQPVVLNNSSPELWRLLADAYSKTDQPRRAITSINNYLNFRPKDTEMIKLLAKEYFAIRQWNEAYQAAKEAESVNPDDLVIQLMRIESGIRQVVDNFNNMDKSVLDTFSQELTELRQKHPQNVDIRILQALIASNLGKTELAENELKQAITDCNDTLNAEMQLAGLYRKTNRIVDASKVYETAFQNHPDSVKARLGLAEIFMESSNVELARECLQNGLESAISKEGKRSFSINLALLELLKGERDEGIKILKNIAEQNDREIQVRLMLLDMKEIQQDSGEVEKLISQIKQIEGQAGVWWRFYQARLWLLSEDWRSKEKEISDLLQNCISADPGWIAPVLMMADLYKKQGDLRRVEDIYKQAIAINPKASDIVNELLTLYESQGRFSDAEQILKQSGVNDRFLNTWQIKMALGTGDISRAIEELKVRVYNDKNDATSRIQLARLIYQQTKDSTQAFEYLDEAQVITPDSINIVGTKAAILKADGRGGEALKIINDYVETHDNFNAYRMRAMYFANEGEYELAEKDYRKLTTFEDNAAAGYELLSNFFAGIKQYEKAISAIDEGLVKYPDNTSLERSLLRLLVAGGPTHDIERAGKILAKLEEKFPQDSELIKFKAAILMENPTPESIETAINSLKEYVKLKPTDVDAYLILIEISISERKYDAARNYAIQGLGINSSNSELMVARSRIELEAGNSQMAAELANIVIQKYTGNTQARDIYIRAALKSRDKSLLREALKMVESALVNNPKDENMLLTRANILIGLGQGDSIIPEMEAYCQVEPGNGSVPALMTLAELYRATGDMAKAEQMIVQAESIDPDNLSILNSRFLLLASQKKYDDISQIVDSYLSAKAKDVPLILNAAAILLSLDSQELKEDGIKIFEHAYTIAPESKDAGYRLASGLYSTGNIERAEQIYKEQLERFPDDIRILNDYAWILQDKHQDYEQALELANKGVALAPDDLHLLDTRGTILLKLDNKLEQAREDFEKIEELSPADSRQQANAYLNLGRINVKLNDNVEAKRCYQRAQEINQKLNIFTPEELTEIQGNI